MLTPKREGLRGSRLISTTPLRHHMDSESMKDLLEVLATPPKLGPLSPLEAAITRSSGVEEKRCNTVSIGVNTEAPVCPPTSPPPGGLGELDIEGALTDELKILQVRRGLGISCRC